MSHQTLTKFWRKHEEDLTPAIEHDGLAGVSSGARTHTVKRAVPLAALPLNQSSVCKVCGYVMLVADGTLAMYHKECRKYRRTHRSQLPMCHTEAMHKKYGHIELKT